MKIRKTPGQGYSALLNALASATRSNPEPQKGTRLPGTIYQNKFPGVRFNHSAIPALDATLNE